jgi:four helix bundle protein
MKRFENPIVWQKARALTKDIYLLTYRDRFAKDYGLSGQIQRASVSVMSNIAEGFDRFNPNEFHQFLSIAKGSCAELRSQLYIACDVGYIDQAELAALLDKANEVSRLINGLRSSVERQRKK